MDATPSGFPHSGGRRKGMYSVLSGTGRVRPCLAILTVLAVPVRLDDQSLRLDSRGPGKGAGCCVVLVENTDPTLDSWLGVHEKPTPAAGPAVAPASPPTSPPAAPPAAAPPVTMARKAGGAEEMDWRLMPFLAAQASGGGAGQPALLSIAVAPPYGQPNAQHEAITYVLISNLPPGATLSHGKEVGDGTWQVPLEGLSGLAMTMPPEVAEPVTLHLAAVTDHGGGVIARQVKELTVPVGEGSAGTLAAAPMAAAPMAVAPSNPGEEPPPAQGGSSHGEEAIALPGGSRPADGDPAGRGTDGVAAESGSSSPSPPRQPETVAADPGPASTPAPAAEPEPPEPPEPAASRAAIAAPDPTPAPAPVAEPSPPPSPPASTVTVATLPALAAPPSPPPPIRQQREEVVQRPGRPPAVIPEATLIKRGDDLFAQGDLAAARLYYERAAAAGSAKAAFALGRTHDPLVHEQLRVRGLSSDPAQAAAWYRRAIANGSADAEQNLQKLTVWLAGRSR